MEEEIVVINNTMKVLKATIIEEKQYEEKEVYLANNRVFDKDIPVVKRIVRVIIEEKKE